MVMPVILLVMIPIFLGFVYVSPFDQPEEMEPELISYEPDISILYFILMGIWSIFLLRILLRIKEGTFKITHRY